MHAVKKEATEPPINARNITEDTSDFLSGQSEPIRQVQLVCNKNKWHDLWRKLITCLFLFFEGGPDKETLSLVQHIFWANKNVFCPPQNKKKNNMSFVTNHVT